MGIALNGSATTGAAATPLQQGEMRTSVSNASAGPIFSGSGLIRLNVGDWIGLCGGTTHSGGITGSYIFGAALLGGAGPQGAIGPIGPQGAGAYTSTSPDAWFLAA